MLAHLKIITIIITMIFLSIMYVIIWNEVVSPVEGGDGDDEENAINEHEKKNRQMEVDSLGRVS